MFNLFAAPANEFRSVILMKTLIFESKSIVGLINQKSNFLNIELLFHILINLVQKNYNKYIANNNAVTFLTKLLKFLILKNIIELKILFVSI